MKKLEKQAQEILKMAEKAGVQSNYFFRTTFERYTVQLELLSRLKEAIDETGMVVSKTYVKGRENVCSNPAIADYNKTATAANSTVTTLIAIIKTLRPEDKKSAEKTIADKMAELMGNDDNDA